MKKRRALKGFTLSKTFFVTGATGFIGFHLTKRLVDAGYCVRCLARSTSKIERLAKLGVEFVKGDVGDLAAIQRGATDVDGVFHLAGLTRESQKHDFDVVNRIGVRNVASVCAEMGRGSSRSNSNNNSGRAPTLVSVSSLASAGPAPKSEFKSAESSQIPEIKSANATFREYPRRLKRETDVPNPISPYGRSKLGGERELLRFANDVPTTIVRPPYVFGPGDFSSLELFKIAKSKGIFLIPGYLDRFYSFIDVRDLAEILVAAMERGERATPTSLDPSPADVDGISVENSLDGAAKKAAPIVAKKVEQCSGARSDVPTFER